MMGWFPMVDLPIPKSVSHGSKQTKGVYSFQMDSVVMEWQRDRVEVSKVMEVDEAMEMDIAEVEERASKNQMRQDSSRLHPNSNLEPSGGFGKTIETLKGLNIS